MISIKYLARWQIKTNPLAMLLSQPIRDLSMTATAPAKTGSVGITAAENLGKAEAAGVITMARGSRRQRGAAGNGGLFLRTTLRRLPTN